MLRFRAALLFVLTALPLVHSQNGDKAGEAQTPIVNVAVPPAPPLTPEEALKSFKVAPGFHVELVASEPMIESPVAAAFDADGRLWVLEMRGYMPTIDGKGEDQPTCRVSVLEDTDGDGKMDKSHVFIDGLVMARAIALVRDGLLVAEPPKLWFCRDTNGDGKADEKVEVTGDYGSPENPEHTANGLMRALDNWIYSANYTSRFRNSNGIWEKEPTAFRGQWGISQDDFGRIFHNSNSDQLRADLIPSQYLARNPYVRATAGVNFQVARDQSVWPIRPNLGVNRGYQKGQLRADGTLATFTGACSPCIYRGDNFPEKFHGAAFMCEPTANIVRCNQLIENDGLITATNMFGHAEFLASMDERFRPVNLYNGPDGGLYVVDMQRGVLQHRIYLTTYLRNQSLSRGLDKPVNLGRIYRVVSDAKRRPAPQLSKASVSDLVQTLSDPNGWRRDMAQRLLVERGDKGAAAELEKVVTDAPNTLARLHALWTLEGLRKLQAAPVMTALKASEPKLRVNGLRLAETFATNNPTGEMAKQIVAMTDDASAEVRWQLMLTLGELRTKEAEDAMFALLKKDPSNNYLSEAALSGVGGRESALIERIVSEGAGTGNFQPFLLGLTKSLAAQRNPQKLGAVLATAATAPERSQLTLLDGVLSLIPLPDKGRAPSKPRAIHFASEPEALPKLRAITNPEVQKRLARIDPLLAWPDKPGLAPEEIVKPLTKEEQARFEAGKELYLVTCGACHQPHGLGQEGLAPPIADSDWATGTPQRLARIVLQGVRGKISVKGKIYEMEMPPLGVLEDEQIAQLLTYVRREWGHTSSPVDPAFINSVREKTGKRDEAWTEGELLKIAE